jgi:small subunit ribosomal protein S21
MLIIEVKKGESIEKALKRYKYKVIKTRQVEKLREKQQYTKDSVKKRDEKQKAIYLQKKENNEL